MDHYDLSVSNEDIDKKLYLLLEVIKKC